VIEYVQVKDFDRFQHYKDRDPPWIKLYVRILEDYAFAVLPDVHKAHLVLLWVLASKMDNKIPKDPKFVSDKLCAKTPVDLDALLASGFLQPWEEKSSRGKREDWPSRYVSAQTRADLLSHAEFKCAACGATEALEIDHITPISKGGTGEPGNLQVLCRKCNRKKRVKLGKKSAEHLRSDPLRRETDVRSPETETETETETENVKLVGTTSWPAEFAKSYEPIGMLNPGQVGRLLKPVVTRYGVDRTREMWAYYIRHAPHMRFGAIDPLHHDTSRMSPADFARNAGTWYAKTQPVGGASAATAS
jgi:5-methylcytosine-specific restriction endonuclease McrA